MNLKEYISSLQKKFSSADKAGLYVTVIFHLTVIIILLASQLTTAILKDNAFLLDFSKQEEKERQMEEEAFKEEISRKLDELLGMVSVPQNSNEQVRNIAVDASAALKDDRGTNAEELYREAARLSKELADGRSAIEDNSAETVDLSKFDKTESRTLTKEYKGPSVVSYSLDGRKASSLRIPAYRCMGGGDVTVLITVDPQGKVIDAKIYDDVSSSDRCLRDFAIRAARLSRFSKLSPDKIKDLPRQRGEIVYRFIPQ